MRRCPAALTGVNAYFAKKIRARRWNAQQSRNKTAMVPDTSHFKRICRGRRTSLTELDEREEIILPKKLSKS